MSNRDKPLALKKGHPCPVCSQKVLETDAQKIVDKDQHYFHKQCFKCTACSKDLTLQTYELHLGKLTCKTGDCKLLASSTKETCEFVSGDTGKRWFNCSACYDQINEDMVKAARLFFHVKCFKCANEKCGKPFTFSNNKTVTMFVMGHPYCSTECAKKGC